MDRAELGALRDAIDTILSWPDSVRGQIAQWLQTDVSKRNRADPLLNCPHSFLTGAVAGFQAGRRENSARA